MSNGKCGICGDQMPRGEEMFEYHGYSGPCPKPPLPKTCTTHHHACDCREKHFAKIEAQLAIAKEALEYAAKHLHALCDRNDHVFACDEARAALEKLK